MNTHTDANTLTNDFIIITNWTDLLTPLPVMWEFKRKRRRHGRLSVADAVQTKNATKRLSFSPLQPSLRLVFKTSSS